MREWQERFWRAAQKARGSRHQLEASAIADFLSMAKERPSTDIPAKLWPTIAARAAAVGDLPALRLAAQNCDLPAVRLVEENLTAKELAEGKKALGFDLLNYISEEPSSSEEKTNKAPFLAAVLSELLACGCDARARAPDGKTPLLRLSHQCRDAVSALIPHSDLDAQDSAGRTILMLVATRYAVEPSLTQELLDAGANPNLTMAGGVTALMMGVAGDFADWRALIPVSNIAQADDSGLRAVDYALKAKNWKALDAFCQVVDIVQAEEIEKRVLEALLPQSRPRLAAAAEAQALREQLERDQASSATDGSFGAKIPAQGQKGASRRI